MFHPECSLVPCLLLQLHLFLYSALNEAALKQKREDEVRTVDEQDVTLAVKIQKAILMNDSAYVINPVSSVGTDCYNNSFVLIFNQNDDKYSMNKVARWLSQKYWTLAETIEIL